MSQVISPQPLMSRNNKDKDTVLYNLALAYQVAAQMKLDDLTYTHISAKIPQEESFFIYPFGMLYEEVTTDCFLNVTLDGKVLNPCESNHYNPTGYAIHSDIYKNNCDISAIIHLHTPASVAVSAQKNGLLPISQWALHFYNQIDYIDYDSLILHAKDKTTKSTVNLRVKNKIIFLRHHGFITCGATIHEAFFYAYHLEKACLTQVLATSNHTPKDLLCIKDSIAKKANTDLLKFEADLGSRDWLAYIRKYGSLVRSNNN